MPWWLVVPLGLFWLAGLLLLLCAWAVLLVLAAVFGALARWAQLPQLPATSQELFPRKEEMK